MSNKFDFDKASDPVCGELVNVDTPHRVEYGGKDLYFCSENCLNQFVADPDSFEGEGTIMLPPGQLKARLEAIRTARTASASAAAPGSPPAVPSAAAPAAPAAPAPGSRPAAPPRASAAPPPSALPPAPPAGPPPPASMAPPPSALPPAPPPAAAPRAGPPPAAAARPAETAAPPPRSSRAASGEEDASESTGTGFSFPVGGKPVEPPSGIFGWLRAHVMGWIEQRHVDKVCRQMMARFNAIVGANPGLDRREYYRRLVIDRLDCTGSVADRVLTQTNNSFASWPKRRDITLRDVIHYISVAEFLSRRDRPDGMYSDVEKLVSERVPANL